MSVYVLDVPRFDKTRHGSVRPQRVVVFGAVVDVAEPAGATGIRVTDEKAIVSAVLDVDGQPVDLGTWMSAERFGVYEAMRKADRNWRALTKTLGRDDEAPGRVA